MPEQAPRRRASARPAGRTTRGGVEVDPRLFVNSVEKAMLVFRAFVGRPNRLSIAEIAKAAGIGRSAAQRLVYTFEKLGYLRRDERTRLYRLTPRVLEFASSYFQSDSIILNAPLCFAEACAKSGETLTLSELDGAEIVIIARSLGHNRFGQEFVVGTRYPAYATSGGRAMLAFLPPQAARDLLERSDIRAFTPHTVTDRKDLSLVLQQVRREGFAIAAEQMFPGTISAAVPVCDPAGAPVAAVNVFTLLERWPEERVRAELIPLLRRTAHMLANSIGEGASAVDGRPVPQSAGPTV